jgi:L-fuconolactonase
MPDFPIIDAHLHLYDTRILAYPWMEEVPSLAHPHLMADFDAARGGVPLEAAIFVEVDAAPGQHLREVDFVSRLAASEPRIAGIVAHVPMDRGTETARDLEGLAAQPLVRGVRHLIQGHRQEKGWALRAAFVAGVQSLAQHGLSFDICIYAEQMAEATALVDRCPDTAFILDHLGKPDIRGGRLDPWRRELAELARRPNVVCKISGLATEADHTAWREDELLPCIDHAIACFGFDRVLFGGDWPVSTLATDYARWVRLVDRAVAGASEEERRKLFRDTARRVYRL